MKPSTTLGRALAAALLLAPLATVLSPAPTPAAAAEPVNAAPGVVPALQQWTGGTGRITLTATSRIVIPAGASAPVQLLAAQLSSETAELTGLRPSVATGAPAVGDIALQVDPAADFGPAKTELRPEAYRLSAAAGSVSIVGGGDKGLYYGTRTLLQAVLGSADRASLPVGTAVDYPNYAVRGFMLDVGRRYYTPEFINSYLHWMGWLKLNTLQLHLNDNEISPPNGDWSQAISAFRLKSTNPAFAGLADAQGYTRQDWDGFESTAAANAVTLVPEIDAPAHSRAFIKFRPSLGLNGGNSDHLDLGKPATTDFMKSVYAEFAPWFRGPTVHIGIDEYPRELTAQYKAYVNTIAPYVRSLGKKVNAWGSFTVMGGSGAGYDKGMAVNSWNNSWYGPKAAIADGYQVINSNDGLLYVVPFADYYHPQGLDGQSIFSSWAPHVFGGGQDLAPQDPNLLGAMPAVWNDKVRLNYTELQTHTLIEKSFAALAQKMWSPTAGGSDYTAFLTKVATVGQGPGTGYLPDTVTKPTGTPGDLAFQRPVTASSTETTAFPASYAVDGNATTRWASQYSDNQWIQVDLGTPTPYSTVRLTWEAAYGKDYDLQTSPDGTTWTTIAQRRGRTTPGTDTLTFTPTTARHLRLQGITRGTTYGYSLYSFEVFAPDLAFQRPVTASSTETAAFPASYAVDGNATTRWASQYTNDQWIQVDLGTPTPYSTVRLTWEAAYGKDYDLQTSTDGTTWTTIAQRRGRTTAGTDTLTFTPTTARHLRLQGITRGTTYGYSLY
ncbi:discoidin domain-containing protein, partial [Kitasatospora sp. NPDC051853]|uniref:discoidin domain-containing protein n=1 Tax=Kitasatospora sp. NPDC051853 TaxID=3364058 RepID=UPI0037973709